VSDRFDVVVAGGGIAGLTAGLFSARLGRTTLVLAGEVPGGLLLNIERIEGYPGFPEGVPGYELCPMAQEQAEEAGAELRMTELEDAEPAGDGWRVATGEGELEAGVLILATGAGLKELGVPGEERLRGHGVSHCATCDGPLLAGRVVGVVGGGDSALQEALTLAEFAEQVIVLQRDEDLTGQESYRRRALEHPKIEVRCDTIVEEIVGEDNVTGVRTRAANGGDADELELGGLFAYVGLEPNSAPVRDRLRLDDEGCIPTDASMRTELPGLFAAGVVRAGAACQAAGSAGDGATAAKAADGYLNGASWPEGVVAAVGAGNGGSGG
jgi:thioredoxin reductase (NADPH)